MRGLVKGLAAALLAAPLLSACVIYDSSAGENVSVNVSRNDAPPAEAIREARFADGALVVRVDSNGCTQASDFEVAVADNNPVEITLRRHQTGPVQGPGPQRRRTALDLRRPGPGRRHARPHLQSVEIGTILSRSSRRKPGRAEDLEADSDRRLEHAQHFGRDALGP